LRRRHTCGLVDSEFLNKMISTKLKIELESIPHWTWEDTDDELKYELMQLAKLGAPRPKVNALLGKALKKFTTLPAE